jgi:hypothetical protein
MKTSEQLERFSWVKFSGTWSQMKIPGNMIEPKVSLPIF